MKQDLALLLLFVFALSTQPLYAQSAAAPQRTAQHTKRSERIRAITGTIRKITASELWLAEKRNHLTVVYSFKITKDTSVSGDPAVGKTATVEYTSKVVRRPDEANTTRKTAIRIRDVHPRSNSF